jgi:hypothetical protein
MNSFKFLGLIAAVALVSVRALAAPVTLPLAVTVTNSPLVQQAGPWSVNLDPGAQVLATIAFGSTVGISSLPAVSIAPGQFIGVTSMPAVEITGTPSVHVVSMPQVQLAGTSPVNVVSMPQVQLAGTSPVNVVSMPQVQLAGTPSVNVLSMPQVAVASLPPVTIANQPGAGERYAEAEAASFLSVPVPSGKRLIITSISATSRSSTTVSIVVPSTALNPNIHPNLTESQLYVPMVPADATNLVGTINVELILEEGQQAECRMRLAPLINGDGHCSFFGRLIDN